MGELRRRYGFWASIGRLNLRDLATLEIVGGGILGATGAVLLVRFSTMPHRVTIAGDYLQLAAALTGVVFAGFALVIGLLSDQYLRWLEETSDGVAGFLGPFMVAVGLQVGAIVGTVFYRAGAEKFPPSLEHWTFGVITVLFAIALLDIVALARSVLLHGVARARGLKVRDLEQQRQRRASGRP